MTPRLREREKRVRTHQSRLSFIGDLQGGPIEGLDRTQAVVGHQGGHGGGSLVGGVGLVGGDTQKEAQGKAGGHGGRVEQPLPKGEGLREKAHGEGRRGGRFLPGKGREKFVDPFELPSTGGGAVDILTLLPGEKAILPFPVEVYRIRVHGFSSYP